jgi:hypothetical protein
MKRAAVFMLVVLSVTLTPRAQTVLSEIRLSPDGYIVEVALTAHDQTVVIDPTGVVKGMETLLDQGVSIGPTQITRAGKNTEIANGSVQQIDNIRFRYTGLNNDRVESVDSLRFRYSTYNGKETRIAAIGCVIIDYEINSNRIETIGNLRLTYKWGTNKISAASKLSYGCAAKVKVINPISDFK